MKKSAQTIESEFKLGKHVNGTIREQRKNIGLGCKYFEEKHKMDTAPQTKIIYV